MSGCLNFAAHVGSTPCRVFGTEYLHCPRQAAHPCRVFSTQYVHFSLAPPPLYQNWIKQNLFVFNNMPTDFGILPLATK